VDAEDERNLDDLAKYVLSRAEAVPFSQRLTGRPAAITRRTSAEIVKVLAKPEVRDKLLKAAVEPVGNTLQEFGAFMKTDLARWGEAAKAAGVSAKAQSRALRRLMIRGSIQRLVGTSEVAS